jgi:4-diphosphocytidyl-2-C-methyl-D-erythritol kinase
MTSHALDLKGWHIVVVHPGLHVSTAEAYSLMQPKPSGYDLHNLNLNAIEQWKDLVINAFEGPVTEMFPEIGTIKSQLYDMGAIYASMSGSGSAVYGLFRHPPVLPEWPESYRVYSGLL